VDACAWFDGLTGASEPGALTHIRVLLPTLAAGVITGGILFFDATNPPDFQRQNVPAKLEGVMLHKNVRYVVRQIKPGVFAFEYEIDSKISSGQLLVPTREAALRKVRRSIGHELRIRHVKKRGGRITHALLAGRRRFNAEDAPTSYQLICSKTNQRSNAHRQHRPDKLMFAPGRLGLTL
jgi:hypothetical protein